MPEHRQGKSNKNFKGVINIFSRFIQFPLLQVRNSPFLLTDFEVKSAKSTEPHPATRENYWPVKKKKDWISEGKRTFQDVINHRKQGRKESPHRTSDRKSCLIYVYGTSKGKECNYKGCPVRICRSWRNRSKLSLTTHALKNLKQDLYYIIYIILLKWDMKSSGQI